MTIERTILQNTDSDSVQDTPLESLKAARTLQKLRRSHGVNRVDLIVEDVEGDWLEQWEGEETTDSKVTPEKIQ